MNFEATALKMNKDSGFSLVELLIAVAIGSIVAAGVSSLLIFSVRTFSNENAKAAAQNELQMSVNQVMDSIVSSSGMVVLENSTGTGAYTKYAAFGKFEWEGSSVCKFSGVVLVSGDVSGGCFNIYMNRIPEASPKSGTNELSAVQEAVKTITDNLSLDPNPYLLAEGVKAFRIEPQKDGSSNYIGFDASTDPGKYVNPITVEFEMEFEKKGFGQTKIGKRVEDSAYMRNSVKSDIYIGSYDGSSETFKCYKYSERK